MAGGKETPRQKMIGMMYLVLTALLALNVSKAILDAFVAIEENVQIANVNEYGRGEEKKGELSDAANDGSQPDLKKKAKKLLAIVNQIDALTAKQIQFIDEMKLAILDKSGEDIKSTGSNFIISTKYSKNDPLKPTRMNLMKVDGKDKYDEPMEVLGIADDIKMPTGDGLKLWNSYSSYRTSLTEILAASSSENGKNYKFKDPKINSFKDFADIKKQLSKSLKNVAEDDKEDLIKIYASLTKQEFGDLHDGEVKNVHWIGRTFDHSPTVAAIASLSSLQKEILTARADAISLIRSRVGTGEYSFNKIMPLAYGPEVANQNEEVEIEVLMAAFNSDKKPRVTVSGGTLKEVRDGKGYIKTKGSSGEIKLTGEITITNKRGQEKTMPWSKTIQVMKPQGTISLPDMMVLYRGYENRLQATASGYPDFKLIGNGVSIRKNGNEFVGTVSTSAKTATIQISGFNKMTNKSVPLGITTFRVKQLPNPNVYWGNVENGGTVSGKDPKISLSYGSDNLLNVKFPVNSWDVSIEGVQIKVSGSGGTLDQKAMNLVRQAKKGSRIIVNVKTIGPDKVLRNRTGVFYL